MFGRRPFLGFLGAAPMTLSAKPAKLPKGGRDVLAELGVRTFINAAGTYTKLTASLMSQDVMAAMQRASLSYVDIVELQEAVGQKIAKLLDCEGAMVTSGAAGALCAGTAGCITGKDEAKIRQLPDTTGLKSEVLMLKKHRYAYDHSVRTAGVKILEADTPADLERLAGPKTAHMLFFNDAEKRGGISAEDFVRLGKKLGIPTFNDASADVPPVDNLKKYTRLGFDLVTFSGGKGLCGPQSAGLLLGRKDLIDAARLNTSPYSDTLARGMKVNKEEMVGMLVALEAYLNRDHDAEWKEWERRVNVLIKAVSSIKTVTTHIEIPEIANHTQHLQIKWDEGVVKIKPTEVMKQLRAGSPSIEACPATNSKQLVFTVWMMQPGDAEIVAKRVQEILKQATA